MRGGTLTFPHICFTASCTSSRGREDSQGRGFGCKDGLLLRTLVPSAALTVLLMLACSAYARSMVVYTGAHDFNQVLASAYSAPHTNRRWPHLPKSASRRGTEGGNEAAPGIGPYRFAAPEAEGAFLEELSHNSLEDMYHINGLRTDPGLGTILFAHPHSRFSIPVSSKSDAVSVEFGILDAALKTVPPTDGVEFRISLRKPSGDVEALWSQSLHPVSVVSDRGPHSVEIPLHAQDQSSLIFETMPGTTFEDDWAYWTKLDIGRGR